MKVNFLLLSAGLNSQYDICHDYLKINLKKKNLHKIILWLEIFSVIHHNFRMFHTSEFLHFKCHSICSIRSAYSEFKGLKGRVRKGREIMYFMQ